MTGSALLKTTCVKDLTGEEPRVSHPLCPKREKNPVAMVKQSSRGIWIEHLICAIAPEGLILPPSIPESLRACRARPRGRGGCPSLVGAVAQRGPQSLCPYTPHSSVSQEEEGAGPPASREGPLAHPTSCFVGSPVMGPSLREDAGSPRTAQRRSAVSMAVSMGQGGDFAFSGTLGDILIFLIN